MLLFRRWDASRKIHMELRARSLIEPTLRHLAYWLLTRADAQPTVAERELVAQTTAYFLGRGFESPTDAEDAATEFVQFCRGRLWVLTEAGTTEHGDPLFAFTHRTFLEYFAAAYLASTHDSPEQLARKLEGRLAKSEWDTVAQLAVQIKDHASERGGERISGLAGRPPASLGKERGQRPRFPRPLHRVHRASARNCSGACRPGLRTRPVHGRNGLTRPLEVAGCCLIHLFQHIPSSCGQYTLGTRRGVPGRLH